MNRPIRHTHTLRVQDTFNHLPSKNTTHTHLYEKSTSKLHLQTSSRPTCHLSLNNWFLFQNQLFKTTLLFDTFISASSFLCVDVVADVLQLTLFGDVSSRLFSWTCANFVYIMKSFKSLLRSKYTLIHCVCQWWKWIQSFSIKLNTSKVTPVSNRFSVYSLITGTQDFTWHL